MEVCERFERDGKSNIRRCQRKCVKKNTKLDTETYTKMQKRIGKFESRNVYKDARKWAFDYKDTHRNVLKNDTDLYVKLYGWIKCVARTIHNFAAL